ncbi:MAG TPA: cbb3-type cytochrome c oxidase subunit II [Candidatus Limnocylindria bacterium]|nr:cbb3-type cytochrome c oxidase subunit II [Candidatus Limnocylindria bacterium]
MKGLAPLFLGIFGTFAFSWVGLTVLPNWQIGHLNPQSDEEGTDIYPQPQSGMFERGARVYAANGCIYCHSQQVRPDYAAADIERGWGNRRSAPRDYIFERPVFLGKMRMGQDLANIGARAPAEQASPAPGGAASPAASAAPGGVAPAAAPPAAKQNQSPSASAQPASPSRAASPSSAASPAAATAGGSSGAAPQGTSSPPAGAPPTGPKTGLASPSPAAAANATPGGVTAPSSGAQIAGPPWPIQTIGEPPMYSAAWHHVHLYSPRSINFDSNMPAYRFLYKKRRISDARSADALQLTGSDAPPEGWEVIPSFDAKCLVAYMMALNQSHPLNEVRSAGGAPPAAGSPAASPAPAAAGSPAPAK